MNAAAAPARSPGPRQGGAGRPRSAGAPGRGPGAHRAQAAGATSDHDPILDAKVELAGLTWAEFSGFLGLHRIMELRRQGAELEDLSQRHRLYANIARRVAVTLRINRGQRPLGWERRAWCEHCGPVWLRGEALPDAAAWPRVHDCPYCSLPEPAQGFARPLVTAGSCRAYHGYPVKTSWIAPAGRCERCAREFCDAERPFYCRRWAPRDGAAQS